MCYTDTKLLAKIQKTLTGLTEELKKVANGEPDKPVKAKTEDAEPAKSEAKDTTKLAEAEVKTPAKAKQAKPEAAKA